MLNEKRIRSTYYDCRSQSYKMKDFGNDAFSGDCFDIVEKIKGWDYNNSKDFIEILQTINHDLSLGIDGNDQSFVFRFQWHNLYS
jgi:hypothetical protein